jgi:hypothetical protein
MAEHTRNNLETKATHKAMKETAQQQTRCKLKETQTLINKQFQNTYQTI